NRSYAYVTFKTEEELNNAYKTTYSLTNANLEWCNVKAKVCNLCGALQHKAVQCPKNKYKANRKYETVYNRYKPSNYDKLLPKTKINDAKVSKGKSYAQAAKTSKSHTVQNG